MGARTRLLLQAPGGFGPGVTLRKQSRPRHPMAAPSPARGASPPLAPTPQPRTPTPPARHAPPEAIVRAAQAAGGPRPRAALDHPPHRSAGAAPGPGPRRLLRRRLPQAWAGRGRWRRDEGTRRGPTLQCCWRPRRLSCGEVGGGKGGRGRRGERKRKERAGVTEGVTRERGCGGCARPLRSASPRRSRAPARPAPRPEPRAPSPEPQDSHPGRLPVGAGLAPPPRPLQAGASESTPEAGPGLGLAARPRPQEWSSAGEGALGCAPARDRDWNAQRTGAAVLIGDPTAMG